MTEAMPRSIPSSCSLVSAPYRTVCSTPVFLGCPSRNFGIVYALALAGRTCLAVRFRSSQRRSVHGGQNVGLASGFSGQPGFT
jgi:hypothetical protein